MFCPSNVKSAVSLRRSNRMTDVKCLISFASIIELIRAHRRRLRHVEPWMAEKALTKHLVTNFQFRWLDLCLPPG